MPPLYTLLSSLLYLSVLAEAGGSHGRGGPLSQKTTKTYSQATYFPEYDAKRVTISYAPVSVPPMTENDGMAQFFQQATTLPCTDCFITWLQMGLEHADGRTAGADTGMWLHHGVMINRNQTDPVCGRRGQRFAAFGNERTALDISAGGAVKTGYYVRSDEQVALLLDLMNMHHDMAQDDIVLTITYEYINAADAKDFSEITMYWLDVSGCGNSEVPAYADSAFNYSSPSLDGSLPGTITFVAGHLHDGGTHIDLVKNGKAICSVEAVYDGANDTSAHISSIPTCEMAGMTVPEDEWSIEAYYDTTKHKPMALMDGSLEHVMGIMLVYVVSGSGQGLLPRPRYWNIVLGMGCLTAAVLSFAAWLWVKESRRIRLGQWATASTRDHRDFELDGESAVPLMKT